MGAIRTAPPGKPKYLISSLRSSLRSTQSGYGCTKLARVRVQPDQLSPPAGRFIVAVMRSHIRRFLWGHDADAMHARCAFSLVLLTMPMYNVCNAHVTYG
jgi:hypothetical protein